MERKKKTAYKRLKSYFSSLYFDLDYYFYCFIRELYFFFEDIRELFYENLWLLVVIFWASSPFIAWIVFHNLWFSIWLGISAAVGIPIFFDFRKEEYSLGLITVKTSLGDALTIGLGCGFLISSIITPIAWAIYINRAGLYHLGLLLWGYIVGAGIALFICFLTTLYNPSGSNTDRRGFWVLKDSPAHILGDPNAPGFYRWATEREVYERLHRYSWEKKVREDRIAIICILGFFSYVFSFLALSRIDILVGLTLGYVVGGIIVWIKHR